MWNILKEKNGFILAHDEFYNDYFFGTKKELQSLSMPCNQYGTKKEIKTELKRWKNEIDFDNQKMLDVENTFLDILNSL